MRLAGVGDNLFVERAQCLTRVRLGRSKQAT